jgi:ataxin-3
MKAIVANIYWERQGSDRLCGVHCINSLLQGPFFDEIQLAQIAQDLDKTEKALMMEQGTNSKDFMKFMAEESNNVADDGNYSMQVLAEALKRLGSIECSSVDSEFAKKSGDLSVEDGFICNSSSHWFSIRKVNKKWYNLNSTNKEGPEMISDFYLSAFLNAVKENGYTIFVVQGVFPPSEKTMWPNLQKYQKWFAEDECQKMHERNLKKKNFKLNIGGTDERDLEEAMENSLKESMKDNQGGGDKMDEEEIKKEEDKFKAFQGKGVSFASSNLPNELVEYFKLTDPSVDPELASVMKMSIAERFVVKPPEDENNLNLNVRFPDGSTKIWTFPFTSLVEDLYDFVKVNLPEGKYTHYKIGTPYPRQYFLDLKKYLLEVGLSTNDVVIVEKI